MKVKNSPANKRNTTPKSGKNPVADVEESSSEVVEESAEETSTEETSSEEVVEEASTSAEETPAEQPEAPVKEVSAKKKTSPPVSAKKKEGWVRFACTRTIDPAPTVGSFNVGRELGVSKLVAGSAYTLPPNVALALVDAQAGMLG